MATARMCSLASVPDLFLLISCAAALTGCGRDDPTGASLDPKVMTGGFAAPSQMSITAESPTQIDVRWQSVLQDGLTFELWRSQTGTFTLRSSTAAVTFSDPWPDIDLASPYCYKVRSLRVKSGRITYSAFSNIACTSSGTVEFTTVTNGVDLDQDGYVAAIQGPSPNGYVWVAMADIAPNGTVLFPPLRRGDAYRARLEQVTPRCAVNSLNPQTITVAAGATSVVRFEITCPALSPPTPPVLHPPEGFFLGTMWLFWSSTALEGESFKIERCDKSLCEEADFTLIATVGAHITASQDYGLLDGVVYTYRIRATNQAGDSEPSNLGYGRSCIEEVDWYSPCFP